MKQPVHAPGKPAAPRQGPPQAALRVRYYRRMRPQRVYPLVVDVVSTGGPAVPLGAQAMTIRPAIPGALVVPAEHRAEALRAGERFTFFVTPLARGRLPEPRVELLQPGRPAQPIPMRMRSVSQRLTWILLALTILVPAGIIYATRVAPLRGQVPKVTTIPDPNAAKNADPANAGQGNAAENAGGPDKDAAKPGDEAKDAAKPGDKGKDTAKPGDKDKDAAKPGDESKKAPKPEKAGADDKRDQGPADADNEKQPRPGRNGGRPGGPPGGPRAGMPGMGGMPPPPPPGTKAPPLVGAIPPGPREVLSPGSPGDVLTYRLDSALNSDLPAAGDMLPSEQVARPVKDAWDATVPRATWGVGWAYDLLCNAPTAAFWIGLMLLALTAISWFTHGARRGSRRAALLLAPAGAGLPHELASSGTADSRPLSVEPA